MGRIFGLYFIFINPTPVSPWYGLWLSVKWNSIDQFFEPLTPSEIVSVNAPQPQVKTPIFQTSFSELFDPFVRLYGYVFVHLICEFVCLYICVFVHLYICVFVHLYVEKWKEKCDNDRIFIFPFLLFLDLSREQSVFVLNLLYENWKDLKNCNWSSLSKMISSSFRMCWIFFKS